ncbi:hypothetical protein VM1G_00391 [Cytospora mali]|uniref:Uncharacterized protein n=2 Tax=Cytospora mali TaxID=578113 RepID=A0ACD6AY49_CYTMA|nr:hypothetical protein VP1G_04309 [Valsa mali var. pyri (nom. inval.)]KUI65076.1 hypothetical protein VM1G_00391 [Valsa mali]
MERSAATDYSGLPSPYPSNFGDTRSEASLSDPSSAQQYTSQSEVRPTTYAATATPTSEYSGYPASARSATFPEHHLQRAYGAHPSGVGGSSMAQTPTSPSMPLQDGRNHQNPQQDHQQIKSDNDVPIDPSIAQPSPTQYAYPPQSPYGQPPTQDMAHGYGHHSVYAQPRPDWTGYGQPGAPITPGHHVFPQTPTTAAQSRPNQVYSFVPIPGAQQHKRPRRRYEEIERMYKCGWNGCEKAYGTLNHLNAHVTMQSHGTKRVPEEFKEIRKEWKARKKAEEAERKAREDEQQRNAVAAQAQNDPQGGHDGGQPAVASYGGARLPPIGYQPTTYPNPPPVSLGGDYSSNYIAAGSYNPTSPYAQSHQQVYGQPNGGQPGH